MDEPTYTCSICHDFQWIDPRREDGRPDYSKIEPCLCVKAELAVARKQALVKWCELPVGTDKMTFENFKVTPKTQEAYNAAVEMADGKFEQPFLTFLGESDTGKTHLMVAICRRWLTHNLLARYAYVPILLGELRSGFREGGDGTYEERWQKFLNIPLLALDDLGTENPTPWVQEHLDTLIDYRLVHGLPTVVTSNLLPTEITSRIFHRLKRSGKIIFMKAPPYSNPKGNAVK